MPETEAWWIVGASEGLGRAVAEQLDADGEVLVLSARSADRLDDLAGALTHARVVQLDVTDPKSVAQAAREVGDVGGLIYSVGNYEPMSARDWNTDRAVTMAETNFIGALRVLGVVLPSMIARGSGRVVLVGSLAGFRGLPGNIGYGASKAALMHLAENLRADLEGTGVQVQVVNPGFIDTRLTRKNDFKMPFLMGPDVAAGYVVRAIRRGRFSTSFPFAFSLLFRLGKLLPIRMFHTLFTK